MPSQYSTETKAEVIEMGRQGTPSRQIARKLSVPLRTAQDWLQHARELAIAEDRDPRLVDGEYRLAYMGQMIQESQLNELADMIGRGESTLKYGLLTNVIKGTSIDKVQKQPVSIGTQNVQVIFNFQDSPSG